MTAGSTAQMDPTTLIGAAGAASAVFTHKMPSWPQPGVATVASHSLAHFIDQESDIAIAVVTFEGTVRRQNNAFAQLNLKMGGQQIAKIPDFQTAVARLRINKAQIITPVSCQIDGEQRHFWARYVAINNVLQPHDEILLSLQDWTQGIARALQMQHMQDRLHDYARATSDWFWECDANLIITDISSQFSSVAGVPCSSFISKTLNELGTLKPNLSGEQPLERALAQRHAFRDQLLELTSAEGKLLLFHLAAVPFYNPAGQFIGFRGVSTDVTRLYRMEAEARATRQSLESTMIGLQQRTAALESHGGEALSALRAKNEFLAAMSHELRTPLNAIIGFAEVMALQVFGPLGERYTSYARDIETAGKHLLGLINDVLDVSVIESGDINMSIGPVALAPLVDRARTLIALRAAQQQQDLSAVRIDPEVTVIADERRVLQILVNLLTNAVKFTPNGGQIGIDFHEGAVGGSQLALTVWDTGPGIASQYHERVFEKFQQVIGDAYASKPEGTGLGLHISRELARLMRGDLTLQSELGKGARFTLTLPLA